MGAPRKRATLGRRAIQHMERHRDAVYLRDGHECLARGTMALACGALTLQHRQGRGMGGGARADGPEHYVTLCAIHNAMAEQAAPFRRLCERNGWSVPRWRDPAELAAIPVKYPDGSWWLLDGWGDRESIPDPALYWAALEDQA